MSEPVTSPPISIEPPSAAGRLLIWGSLWGGGVAWFLHLLAVWAFAEFGCLSRLAHPGPLDVSWVAWLGLVASLLCFALGGVATWASWRCRQRLEAAHPPAGGETARFVVRCGLVANPFFMLIIVTQTLPIFYYLRDCGTYIVL